MANEAMERELGWDDEIKNESTFELLPEGEYTYMVESFERGRYEPTPKAKLPACNMVTLSLKITGNDQSATLQHRLFLHTRCEGMLCDFFTSIGMRKHGEPLKMNWPAVAGRRGRCKIGVRTWKGDDGVERQSNEVKRFLDFEPEKMAAPATGYTQGKF